MSRRYTNKELRESLITLDKVLFDVLYNAYDYMDIIAQQVEKLKSSTDDQSVRQMNASAQTMCLINFLVHPAHETSKRYFPKSKEIIDGYIASQKKAFELGYAICYCETECDPGKVKFKLELEKRAEALKAKEVEDGQSGDKV